MNTRQKILVLTSRFPYPVIGGDRLRIYALCKFLARENDLTLLSLCETEDEMSAPLPEDGVFKSVERVLLPKWQSILNTLFALPTRTPLQVAYYKSSQFKRMLDQLLPENDLCLAHLIRTGDYMRGRPTPTVLEMTDAISMNYGRMAQYRLKRSLKKLVYRIETSRLTKYERAIVDEFGLTLLVSDVDREFLLKGRAPETAGKVMVCSNGVDIEAFPLKDRTESAPVAVYIGNMTSMQNLDACFHFAEEILPYLRKTLVCTFRVVGRIGEANARKLRSFDGVEVTGTVESVVEAVSDARVGVAPVRIGAGVQNKVLEYMALGLPVVASPMALEGFNTTDGEDCFSAISAADYVELFQSLWDNPQQRLSVAQAGRRYVETHHSWNAHLKPLRDRLLTLKTVGCLRP